MTTKSKAMKHLTTIILLFLATLSASAGKPLYSGKYNVIHDGGKHYSVQVGIYKTFIVVGKERCPYTNQLNGWRIFHAGTNGGYTSLYYVDPISYDMRKVIQFEGKKQEYAMHRVDTTVIVGEQRYLCLKCNGTGRIAVHKLWNSGMNRDELQECPECGQEYYKSSGHRHEDCPSCAGRGYTLKKE